MTSDFFYDHLQDNLESVPEDIKSQFKLAQSLIGKNDIESQKKAFELFLSVADQGFNGPYGLSTLAKYNLAVCYEKGLGVGKSATKAVKYYREIGREGWDRAYSYANVSEKKNKKKFKKNSKNIEKVSSQTINNSSVTTLNNNRTG